MKTQHVKVVRAFLMDGKPKAIGDVFPVPFGFATELRSGGKAVFVDPPVEKPSEQKPELSAAKAPQKGAK